MIRHKLHVIGELMNNSYARARRAFLARCPADYQELAASRPGSACHS